MLPRIEANDPEAHSTHENMDALPVSACAVPGAHISQLVDSTAD